MTLHGLDVTLAHLLACSIIAFAVYMFWWQR